MQSPDPEPVNNAFGKWRFRSYHSKVNVIFLGSLDQRLYIGGFDIQVVGNLGGAGITRSNVNLFDFLALSQLPDQGMLPGTAANN